MSGKRRHEEDGDSSSKSGTGPALGGAQKLLAMKKARRTTTSNDMVTSGVGRSASGLASTPTMTRLQPPPVTPSPGKAGLVGHSPALGIHTGGRGAAMTLLSTPADGNTPSLSRGYWAAFKSGLTPSLSPISTGFAASEDPDSLPSAGVLPVTLANAAFTFVPGTQSATAGDNNLEDTDVQGASDVDEDEDEDELLTWWQIAGRAIDTVYANVGWYLGYRELYLLEDLRLAAPPQYEKCVECVYFKGVAWNDAPAPEFRCEDCRGGEWCRDCVRHVHRYNPFHRIEKLVGGFWQRVRDKSTLGIEVQLMHAAGDKCKVYDYARVDNFAVIHENGIHSTRVQFCKCSRGRSVDRWAQLMRFKLWPATSRDPKTATTYEALDTFTRLSMLGRLSGYDFHRAIEAATDGARVFGLSSLRKQFMRCARQFGHILLFKRAGRGHEDGGIAGTPHGGCAIVCPACPREGYNIPVDWRSRLFPWSYRVILSTDANFRLSNRLTRSTESTDPCFNDGRAYMVPMKEYNAYVDSVDVGKDDEERADCSRFKAQGQANLKGGKGLRTTGVAGVFCARHEFWQPLGLAPLKKGERYSTIDFISTMVHSFLRAPVVVHSYDIACQWHKNLQKRLKAMEEGKHGSVYAGARTMLKRVLVFIVPKFHIFAHVLDCFVRYNPSHTRGVGQTDGEACERVWASMNGAATSLREMGPGAMRDALDLMCSFWNWFKACSLPKTLRTRLQNALTEARIHAGILTAFTNAIEERDPEKLAQWTHDVVYFEEDMDPRSGRPCPYKDDSNDMASAEIEKLAKETDETQPPIDETQPPNDETQPHTAALCTDPGCAHAGCSHVNAELEDADELGRFVLRGLKIEDMRAKSKEGVADEPADLDAGSAKGMAHAVLVFKEEQQRLMPGLLTSMTGVDALPNEEEACNAKLYLPSELPSGIRTEYAALAKLELELREPRLGAALNRLRTLLQLRTYINKSKKASSRSQGAKTRARDAQGAVDKRVAVAAEEYRRHRVAYLTLAGGGSWEKRYRVLQPSDVRGLGDKMVEQMEGLSQQKAERFIELTQAGAHAASTRTQGVHATSAQTKFKVSWIWYNVKEGDDLEISDDLMIEWCKARARAQRWVEEVITLWREMQSVLQACEQDALEWDRRAAKADGEGWFGLTMTTEASTRDALAEYEKDSTLFAGLRAYALKQAHVRRERARRARAQFDPFADDVELFLKTHSEDGWQWEAAEGRYNR